MSVSIIDSSAYQRALALRDLTDIAHGPHAMQQLVSAAIAMLRDAWRCPVLVHRAPPVVATLDNYDRLHYPSDGAAREARYTRYVSSSTLLRTQTSAMIPTALRLVADAQYEDVLIACPGLTYRRDAIDRLHVGEPHQLDLWRVRRGTLQRADLEKMIRSVAAALLPGAAIRIDPTAHPYTTDGCEVHADIEGKWVEILECGLGLPKLLAEAGLDPQQYCALAMGIGLDRVLMLRKGIDDIRLLRSGDERVAGQMLDLEPYRPVSAQPPIQRDMSIAIDPHVTPEELGDRVRASLGNAADCIESVAVLSETRYLDLAPAARRRLGIAPHQKNVLLRVVIRDLTRTLTTQEANELRDKIYGALHAGSVYAWASRTLAL
jgi:phenylalanyl-tRNA synthetase alpha chain